jgi:beta-xylosidase
MNRYLIILLTALLFGADLKAQIPAYLASGKGNPILPGYFADPTIKKFGDTWYIYATTDGNNDGRGPAEVWSSKDFVNWTMYEMNWPISQGGFYWAPDVTMGPGGKYHLLYNIPCQTYIGTGDTPFGPWKNSLGEDHVLIPDRVVPGVITLDSQIFTDDDGKNYVVFGTWGIYPGGGCGIGLLNPDMKSVDKYAKIPNTEATDFFEGPFLFKKDGIYYFTYSSASCHDATYKVQYAISRTSPLGPYEFGKNNPILQTSADSTVHGPGHHSVIRNGNDYYMVYHRHNNPHSERGMHRQVCADKMVFGPDGSIEKLIPTHTGIGYLAENSNPFPNLAFGKKVTVSSSYNQDFKPEYAVDDNNGTLWLPADNEKEQWLMVDLGQEQTVKRVYSEFWFPSYYYQYLIEYSADGKIWKTFSDKRQNTQAGCPMVDYGNVKARFLRITITNAQLPGLFLGMWNFKVFADAKNDPQQLLVHLTAEDLPGGDVTAWPNTKGMLGGSFISSGEPLKTQSVKGRKAVVFDGMSSLRFTSAAPGGITGKNSFTLMFWAYSNVSAQQGCVLDWASEGAGKENPAAFFFINDNVEVSHGKKNRALKAPLTAGYWHHIAVTYNGTTEILYVDGKLQSSKTVNLNIAKDDLIIIGNTQVGNSPFKGALNDLRIYNRALAQAEIEYYKNVLYTPAIQPAPAPVGLIVDVDVQPFKPGQMVSEWKNNGLPGGIFSVKGVPAVVDIVDGRKSLVFTGNEFFLSSFTAPLSLSGNSSFTIAYRVYNPEIAEAEYIAGWAGMDGPAASSAIFGYGSNPERGLVMHNGWADLGFKGTAPAAGKWQQVVVTFDGYMEKVFIDGVFSSQHQRQLYVKAGDAFTIGAISPGNSAFTGALSSLKIYDKCLSGNELKALFEVQDQPEMPVYLSPAVLPNGKLKSWKNSGYLNGNFESTGSGLAVQDVNGKLAVSFNGKETLRFKTNGSMVSDNFTLEGAFLNDKNSALETLLSLKTTDNKDVNINLGTDKKKGAFNASGNIVAAYAGNVPEAGTWHHFAVSVNTSEICLYVDGKPVFSGKLPFACSVATVVLGADDLNKFPFTGSCSSLWMYNRCLNADAIATDYSEWINNSKFLDNKKALFTVQPTAITTSSVYLQAQLIAGAQYNFELISENHTSLFSGWGFEPDYLFDSLNPEAAYTIILRIKDAYGNVLSSGNSNPVTTSADNFVIYNDNFKNDHDFLSMGTNGTAWDGFVGNNAAGSAKQVACQQGNLVLESAGTMWDGQKPQGPFLFKNIADDFVAETRIADVSGLAEKIAAGNNDCGLMVRVADTALAGEGEDLIQLSVFTAWNVGNLFTNLDYPDRMQEGNASSWLFDRYLRIERIGNSFHARSSADGMVWKEIKGSPVARPDLDGLPLQVGLFQSTYGTQSAWGRFSDFRIFTPKTKSHN